VHTTVDDLLGTGPGMPVATRFAMTLALNDWIVETIRRPVAVSGLSQRGDRGTSR
jgi:hypothetical protein